MQVKKILLPVDGSEHSKRAADYAIKLARLLDAEILLIHACRVPVVETDIPGYAQTLSALRVESQLILETFKKLLQESGVRFQDKIVEGRARDVIPDVAQKGIDLVVMGSHGRTNLEGLVLGSVTQRVLSAKPHCPVLVV
ncbi:MAG: universal stress protein [Thermodesulfobacteriota bacterium]|nr:universal stress protein [Thermodesulfobacteriota bacterium]